MRYYKVVMSDSQGNNVEFIAFRVEWKAGGDTNVDVSARIPIDVVNTLDNWEANQTQLNVSIEPIVCYSGFEQVECPDVIKEIESQEGTAIMTYDYIAGPDDINTVAVIIHLTFQLQQSTTSSTTTSTTS